MQIFGTLSAGKSGPPRLLRLLVGLLAVSIASFFFGYNAKVCYFCFEASVSNIHLQCRPVDRVRESNACGASLSQIHLQWRVGMCHDYCTGWVTCCCFPAKILVPICNVSMFTVAMSPQHGA